MSSVFRSTMRVSARFSASRDIGDALSAPLGFKEIVRLATALLQTIRVVVRHRCGIRQWVSAYV